MKKLDKAESESEFCIDGVSCGNVTRFINHSCEPNLFVQCILSSHHDIRLARIVLFAADDIPPMQVISFGFLFLSLWTILVLGDRICAGHYIFGIPFMYIIFNIIKIS